MVRIIEPKVELVTEIDAQKIMQNIETAARNCYKTENKDAEKMCRMLLEKHHEAMIEFSGDIDFLVTTDIGTQRDFSRHRHISMACESSRYCVAGDTVLRPKNPHTKDKTIEDLYLNKENSKNGSWKRMFFRQLNENTGEMCYSKIKNIFYNGVKDLYEIKTRLGYHLKCTGKHRIYTPNGYVKLEDLAVGDKVYVNGTEINEKEKYKDRDWLYYQNITLNKTFVDIGKEFGYNVSTLKKWKRKHKLPSKGTGYFNVGKTPWNKGLSEDNPMVKRQAEALRKYHHSGNDSERIKKINTKEYQKYNKGYCEICGSTFQVEIHHIDKNHSNNYPENLISVCKSCHGGLHHNSLTILHADEITSITYVGKDKVYDLEMDSIYHNYNANGIIVHNCNYSKDKFGNQITVIKPCNMEDLTEWRQCMEDVERHYMNFQGTPDQKRLMLSLSTACTFHISANLREWRHILRLRASKAAHPSVQWVANQILNIFRAKGLGLFFEDLEL